MLVPARARCRTAVYAVHMRIRARYIHERLRHAGVFAAYTTMATLQHSLMPQRVTPLMFLPFRRYVAARYMPYALLLLPRLRRYAIASAGYAMLLFMLLLRQP